MSSVIVSGDAIGVRMWAMNMAGKPEHVIQLAQSNGFRLYNM
jgi:hypothetical protein